MKAVNCPVCQKIVQWNGESEFKPFCSERCKLIDFGDWINENHRILGDIVEAADLIVSEKEEGMLS